MNLPKRQKYLIFIAILLICAVGYYRVYPLINASSTDAENNNNFEQRIITLHKRIKQKKQLNKKLIHLEKQLDRFEAGLIDGATPALAAVNIQNLFYELGSQYNADITSIRVLKSEKLEEEEEDALEIYTVIAVEARMNISIVQLKNILYGLVKSQKLLSISSLQLQRIKAKDNELLSTAITLRGLMRSG